MTKVILIVEDNLLNQRLFHDLLKHQGYELVVTGDGFEALALTRRHRPDLILMDIQLPQMSGLEVVRWIREDDELRSTPIVALTALALVGDKERMLEGGCDAYIAKPISIDSFLATVRRILA